LAKILQAYLDQEKAKAQEAQAEADKAADKKP